MEKIFLSILIPAYNEQKKLRCTLEDVSEHLKGANYTYEVLIVDDGSKDDTALIAESCKELFTNFRLISNGANRGKGFTVKRGISEAKGEYILFMDADSSTSIKQLDKFMPFSEDFDICIASRRVKGAKVSMPLSRAILGKIFILLSKAILGIRVHDINCGFKVFRTVAAKDIFSKQVMSGWSFDAEVLFLAGKNGYSIKEIPIEWTYSDDSKVNPVKDGVDSFFGLIAIRMNDLKGIYRSA